MEKTIIRREHDKQNPYAQVNRKAIQNPKLSWKAKGLLAYLLSLPDNWQIYIKELSNHSRDGITTTRTAFRQLVKAGHIKGQRRRNEKGSFLGYEYIVIEEPKNRVNKVTHPHVENPHVGNLTLLNKDLTQIDFNSFLDADTARDKQERISDMWRQTLNNIQYPKRVN